DHPTAAPASRLRAEPLEWLAPGRRQRPRREPESRARRRGERRDHDRHEQVEPHSRATILPNHSPHSPSSQRTQHGPCGLRVPACGGTVPPGEDLMTPKSDAFAARARLAGTSLTVDYYRLGAVAIERGVALDRLPVTVKI